MTQMQNTPAAASGTKVFGLWSSVFSLSAGLCSSVFSLFFLSGCGSGHPAPTYPVTGKVVFSDDGTPLSTGGAILWESTPDEPGELLFNARGAIQADGTFELTTFEEGDGAVAGEHRVLVRPKRDASDWTERGIVPRPVIAQRLESYETSELRFTVKEESNDFTVTVERPTARELRPGRRMRPPDPATR